MSTPFRQHMDVLSKSPAAAHGLAGRSPASAEEGGLLFGDFLLAIQEKVTRAPQAHESSCCNQTSDHWIASTKISEPDPVPRLMGSDPVSSLVLTLLRYVTAFKQPH
jgi:hypothetical protein